MDDAPVVTAHYDPATGAATYRMESKPESFLISPALFGNMQGQVLEVTFWINTVEGMALYRLRDWDAEQSGCFTAQLIYPLPRERPDANPV